MADSRTARATGAIRRLKGPTALGVIVAALGTTIVWPPHPLLVWNATASAPIGLYMIGSAEGVRKGDMVLARVPQAWRGLAGERRYIPVNVPLVKRVAASDGDTVCALGRWIIINGRVDTERQAQDSQGRTLP